MTRRLVSLISTKGKTSAEAAVQVMAAWKKYGAHKAADEPDAAGPEDDVGTDTPVTPPTTP